MRMNREMALGSLGFVMKAAVGIVVTLIMKLDTGVDFAPDYFGGAVWPPSRVFHNAVTIMSCLNDISYFT